MLSSHNVAHRFLSIAGEPAAETCLDHEQTFEARYGRLLAFARRLTGDRALADDLLHDAYVQLVVSRPELAQIADVDAYLTTLIRNLHVSSQRRKANQRRAHVAIEEYDTAERALEKSGPHQRVAAREALGQICAHVCRRKETSKSASVLILRFFHGFYPTEIERLLRVPARSVSRLLADARAEARVMLANPARLRTFHTAGRSAVSFPALVSEDSAAIAAGLRDAIFHTSVPPCLEPRVIRRLYARERVPIGTGMLAHIVSCGTCLNRICAVLDLPPVDERSPTDPPSGPNSLGTDTADGPLRKARRRGVRDLLEHHPKELQISANGLPVGLLRVAAAENRVRWTVRVDEPLAFVELHSEQDVRMLLLNLSPPTEGALIQQCRVTLSEGRWLELAVDFSELHPAVTVEYVDPSLATASAQVEVKPHADREALSSPVDVNAVARRERSLWSRLSWLWRRQPARLVRATVVLLAMVASWWWVSSTRVATPEASTLMARAVAAEASVVVQADRAVHRTLRLVVRRADAATTEADHRIDMWTVGGTAMRSVRVLDGGGHVLAGQWTDAARRTTTLALGRWDEIWQAGLSAAAFQDRYATIGRCAASEDRVHYTISCERPLTRSAIEWLAPTVHAQADSITPVGAQLTLRRLDLRPVRLTLTLHLGGIEHVTTVQEEGLEEVPASTVPADVFTPRDTHVGSVPAPAVAAISSRSSAVTPSLEMRLVELVDRLPAGEYLSVKQQGHQALAVTGLVRDARAKQVVLDATASLNARGAITTDLQTFTEASQRAGDTRGAATRVEMREATGGPAPVEEYFRVRLPPGADAGALVRQLAPRVLGDARRARRSAAALEALIDRFGEQALASLDDDGRAAWRAFVTRRIADVQVGLQALDAALAPYFDPTTSASVSAVPDVTAAIRRLAHETSIVETAVTTAFSAGEQSQQATDAAVAVDVRQHVHDARAAARHIDAFILR